MARIHHEQSTANRVGRQGWQSIVSCVMDGASVANVGNWYIFCRRAGETIEGSEHCEGAMRVQGPLAVTSKDQDAAMGA